jgi:hypothetical protein
MAENEKDRNPGYGIFGLSNPRPGEGGAAGAGSEAPSANAPQTIVVQTPPQGFAGGQLLPILVVLLLVVSGVNLYLGLTTRQQLQETIARQEDQANLLTRRLDSSDQLYADLRGEFQVTRERLGLTQQELERARSLASNIQKEQREAVQTLTAAIEQKAGAEEVDQLQAEANKKFGALTGDLAGTQQDLEATKQALAGARGELGSAIARTRDELVALARRSDRDYFEFSLPKRRARQKIGTLVIELDKADPKKNLYNINLYFDDKRTPRKDRAINEPLYFYVHGAGSALELVVNKVGKDSVAGYVSAPKGFFADTPNVLAARPGA